MILVSSLELVISSVSNACGPHVLCGIVCEARKAQRRHLHQDSEAFPESAGAQVAARNPLGITTAMGISMGRGTWRSPNIPPGSRQQRKWKITRHSIHLSFWGETCHQPEMGDF